MNAAFMREAIRISVEKMRANQGGPFGAVVVCKGEIVGRGWNRVTSLNDPTAHAEIMAIRDACQQLGTFRLQECEIYSSCEPCPMCLAAIYWSRLEKLYYGNTRQDAAAIGFDDEFIYEQLALASGTRKLPSEQCCRDEALAAFHEWRVKADKILY